ncbi:MAG: glycosyltransferase family 4 protein [Dysgonomonas sp.]
MEKLQKKIVLVNQSSGYLMIDIVNEFADTYDEVVLMYGTLRPLDVNLSDKVKHSRIIQYNRKSALSRILTWLIASVQICFRLLLKYRYYEVFYVTNPPMSYLVSLFLHRPYSILIYDIYPDALMNIGMSENNILYRIWSGCNRKVFKAARCIFTLSEGMKSRLIEYADSHKIHVIPNWSHSENFRPIHKEDNPFIKQYNLEGKFIILYSGNIGYTHNLESVVELAKLLSTEKEVQFLIIGNGAKKQKIINMVNAYGLNNCLFLDWQMQEILPYSLASADLGIVTINDKTSLLSVPSKTYHLLAAGVPLLCFASQDSELNKLILEYQNGYCFVHDDLQNIVSCIMNLKNDFEKIKELSTNSLSASLCFTKQNARKYVEFYDSNY